MHKFLVGSLLCAGCAALLGCGGGGGGSGSFTTKADAICSQQAAAAAAVTRTPAQSTQAATQQVDALVSGRESALRKLKALSPPSSDATSYHAFLAEFPAVEAAWRGGVAQIAKGAAAYNAGGAAAAPLDRAQAAAHKAGLSACGGTLPAADVSAITSFVQAGELHPTPSVCTQQTSKRFLAVSGGLKACLDSTKTHSAQVRISGLGGTAPLASALVARTGGNQPAGNFTFWLVKLNGRWQLDDAY